MFSPIFCLMLLVDAIKLNVEQILYDISIGIIAFLYDFNIFHVIGLYNEYKKHILQLMLKTLEVM